MVSALFRSLFSVFGKNNIDLVLSNDKGWITTVNYVIGGLRWVHLIKLADVTVRFQESDNSQPYTKSIEK